MLRIYTYIHMCIYIYIRFVSMYIYIYIYIRFVCVYIYIYIYIYNMYIYIYTYLHMKLIGANSLHIKSSGCMCSCCRNMNCSSQVTSSVLLIIITWVVKNTTLLSFNIAMEITIFHWKIHYFNGHVQ